MGEMLKFITLLSLILLALLSGCNSANHGSFVSNSYNVPATEKGSSLVALGKVEGKSCQTAVLYLLPYEDSASTHLAIEDAKSKREGTVLLGDISIDDKLWVEFGYSVQCILVNATAYGVKASD